MKQFTKTITRLFVAFGILTILYSMFTAVSAQSNTNIGQFKKIDQQEVLVLFSSFNIKMDTHHYRNKRTKRQEVSYEASFPGMKFYPNNKLPYAYNECTNILLSQYRNTRYIINLRTKTIRLLNNKS